MTTLIKGFIGVGYDCGDCLIEDRQKKCHPVRVAGCKPKYLSQTEKLTINSV